MNRKSGLRNIIVLLLIMTVALTAAADFSVYAAPKQISAAKAKKIAKKLVGGGTVVKCRKDYDDRGWEYEIAIIYKSWKYEMDVQAGNGRVHDFESKKVSIISKTKAKKAAIKKVGGGKAQKITLSMKDDRIFYKITLKYKKNKYTMDVAAKTGRISNYKKNGKAPATAKPSSNITAEQAKKIALAKAGGGYVIKCKRDREDGREIYEIEIIFNHYEYEFEIGVKDGVIYQYDFESVYDD